MMKRAILAAIGLLLTCSIYGQSNLGEVQIYVFSEAGLPVEGVTVEVDGETYTSNADGLINFRHPPGTHEFLLVLEDRPIGRLELTIRQARATEAIVTASDEATFQQSEEDEPVSDASGEQPAIDLEAPGGTLRGVITAVETGEPVAGATVIFRGVDFETTTDEAGEFSVELPAGEYSLSIIAPEFSTITRDNLEVRVDQETVLEVALTPSAIRLDEVPVFASEEVIVQGGIANLIEETRNSGVVVNLIGTEQISRTGDSDAAGALQRVTGLTIVDGEFVYVRGMGERYSSSLLNDARLPSPEVDKRVVPLDLFPAAVIESISVQKSYSPDLAADFGGGAISIRSLGIPDDRYQRRLRVDVGASIGYNLGTTFTERLAEPSQSLDFLGFDDGTRALPESYEGVFLFPEESLAQPGTYLGPTPQEIADLESDLQAPVEPEERVIPLDVGGNISVRDRIEINERRSLGYNLALLYSRPWSYSEGNLNSYLPSGDGIAPENYYTTTSLRQNVNIGSLLDLVYQERGAFEIDATTLLVRATESSTNTYEGFLNDDTIDIRGTELNWTEESILSQSLGLSTRLAWLNEADYDARYTFSLARRYQPDQRLITYQDRDGGGNGYNEDDEVLVARSYGATRIFTNVTDYVHDATTFTSIPLFLFGRQTPDFLDAGLYAMYQIRESDRRRFNYNLDSLETAAAANQDPEDLFTPENLDPDTGIITFEETTISTDNYNATHLIGAGYTTLDLLLLADIRLNAGARVEYSRQTLTSFDLQENEFLEPQVLETLDVLPAVNLTIPMFENSQLRLGGSRTVNRPDLAELSPSPRYGPPGFGQFNGNPGLEKAVLYHADARFETYVNQEESWSLGGFYKLFENPIEVATLYGAANKSFPINVPSATNFGVELEWALQMRLVSDLLRSFMLSVNLPSAQAERRFRRTVGGIAGVFRDLRTTGNVAFIQSQINIGESGALTAVDENGDQVSLSNTEPNRPLQGQAPYVINLALGYRNGVSWSQDMPIYTSLFVNYNVVGPWITTVGTQGITDYYQQPFNQLDIVFRQQIGYIFSFSIQAENVLDPLAVETVGPDPDGEVVESNRRGRSLSISVSLSF